LIILVKVISLIARRKYEGNIRWKFDECPWNSAQRESSG